MTTNPPPPGHGPRWVDPDAPTGIAAQQQRPPARGWAAPPSPRTPPPTGPAHHQPPSRPRQPAPAPMAGPWGPPAPPQQPPWPGPAGPGGPTGPGVPHGAFGPPGGRPPTRNRRNLVLALSTAAVVLVVAVIAIVGFSGSGSAGGGDGGGDLSAGDTVKAYLQALSDGDATKALTYGSAQPANTKLLTDDVLRKQLAKMPITDIRILDEDKSLASIGRATVHVAASFGKVVNDVQLDLKLDDKGAWKLPAAAIKVDAPTLANQGGHDATVTIFGADFKNGSLYTFPGYLDVSSTNDYLTATADPLLLDDLRFDNAVIFDPKVSLNDDGRRAIHDQIAAAYAKCQSSNLLAPPGCPVEANVSDGIDGTVTWGPADLSAITIGDLSPFDTTVLYNGKVEIPVSYGSTRGGTRQGVATSYGGGWADVSKTPPQLHF